MYSCSLTSLPHIYHTFKILLISRFLFLFCFKVNSSQLKNNLYHLEILKIQSNKDLPTSSPTFAFFIADANLERRVLIRS